MPPMNMLNVGERLDKGNSIVSPDGNTKLTLAGNGKLTVTVDGTDVWAEPKNGRADGLHADMQGSGNLVLYAPDSNSGAYWSSDTENKQNNTILVVHDNGNVAMYRLDNPCWQTKTFRKS